jgi:hypothetical protein
VVLLPSEVTIWRECIPLHHSADYRDKGDPAWICRLEGKYWVRFKEVGSFSSISFSLFFSFAVLTYLCNFAAAVIL